MLLARAETWVVSSTMTSTRFTVRNAVILPAAYSTVGPHFLLTGIQDAPSVVRTSELTAYGDVWQALVPDASHRGG